MASYLYDANGNRTQRTVNGTVSSYTYDPGDKMLTGAGRTYSYDLAGRTTQISLGGQVTTFTYDDEDRVKTMSGSAGTASHTYNGLDTRISTVENGASRAFHRDGAYVTDPVLSDGQAVYTPGISERRSSVSTFLHSGLKNVGAQTGTSQLIGATRTYDAFGGQVSSSGSWKGPFGYGGEFGYQGDASGLQLLGHRYYDPSTGRFLTRDPAKAGRNWYTYCENDPIGTADPLGLDGFTIFGFEFNGDVWRNGLRTGAGAVAEELSGGLYEDHYARKQVGYQGSSILAQVGTSLMPQGKAGKGAGVLSMVSRGKNKISPNVKAVGPHTVFQRGKQGNIIKYDTYRKPKDSRNPAAWEYTKRYHGEGKEHSGVETPHVHRPGKPVRKARPKEMPNT